MVRWRHQLNGHEFQQTPGDSGGQKILVCCSPWDHKESDMTWQLINNKLAHLSVLHLGKLPLIHPPDHSVILASPLSNHTQPQPNLYIPSLP